jgi:hypothetical protein
MKIIILSIEWMRFSTFIIAIERVFEHSTEQKGLLVDLSAAKPPLAVR